MDLYFLTQTRETFKSTIYYRPYFYVALSDDSYIPDAKTFLLRRFQSQNIQVDECKKEDLDMSNHLSGKKRTYMKLSFLNVSELMEVRRELLPVIRRQMEKGSNGSGSSEGNSNINNNSSNNNNNVMDLLCDIREYDVPFLVRTCIDMDIRAGKFYEVLEIENKNVSLTLSSTDDVAKPKVLAFDIECTKAALKFPNAENDEIYMISYMIDGQGYLIISRDIVSEDIEDFEYNPKPAFPGPFKIFNEKSEEDLIRRFFSHVQELRPQVIVTYNGDFFDWPFLETRAEKMGLSMAKELGVEKQGGSNGEEYRGRCCVHMDAFSWVRRDSYLPQGSQGLKAVTKAKLKYDPVEIDPEDMVRFARERPVHMASYSVSDAVATYYLYDQYVHLFIFSLCTLIPMNPEDVLRKGSGTLCESLLQVEAFKGNIICPNKHVDPLTKFHNGHLVEAETYIGGHVECLETGVYRDDIKNKFNLVPSALQKLIDNIDRDLSFFIEVEGDGDNAYDKTEIVNYDEVRCEIVEALELLRDKPVREEEPYIYHLDVGAMYPNIILTNRLQPGAIVDEATCAACDFNQEENKCKRQMEWIWRGDYNPASKTEYDRALSQLQYEVVDGRPFHEHDKHEQAKIVASRLKQYSHKVYKKTKVTKEEIRKDTVCMRENDFYIETVRNFRDTRYKLKKATKEWNIKKAQADVSGDIAAYKMAANKALVNDSLQVAHKCILNSFYGYVMRKGARWRSMEMAGIVTLTGANLITQARELVEQIGRPLELDTDGIWCILPKSFPDKFTFIAKNGKKLKLEYPCCMLNSDVAENYSNHQYQSLKSKKSRAYTTRSECSIYFEVDGPYKAMILPASTEEGKLLKKRYAVFDMKGGLSELKGFELKRRGELELIKAFQGEIFKHFLDGDSLETCYDSVAQIANHWLDVIDTQGESLDTDELFELISENRSMSRTLEDYGDQKGTSLTTARRLGEFLGKEMIQDKGLNCKFIIAERPYGAPVTDRAIPVAIFRAEPAVMKTYLRRWLKDAGMVEFDIRSILDWDYYRDRLAKTIQKIITIPAALQNVDNPCPRVVHPEWLTKVVRRNKDSFKQKSITSMFTKLDDGVKATFSKSSITGSISNKMAVNSDDDDVDAGDALEGDAGSSSEPELGDIEDTLFGGNKAAPNRPVVHSRTKRKKLKVKSGTVSSTATTITPEKKVNLDFNSSEVTKDSFDSWLNQRKRQWRMKRREERRSRSSFARDLNSELANGGKKVKLGGGVAGYLKDAAQTLTHGEWHVIEIRESFDTPGEFFAWVMINNDKIQRVSFTVPRTIYIDCNRSQGRTAGYKNVKRDLPHAREATNLYEVTMPEHRFQKNLNDPRSFDNDVIEGVYETKMPLSFSVLTQLGCVSQVSRYRRKEVEASKAYALGDLERVSKPSNPYLSAQAAQLKQIYLFQSSTGGTLSQEQEKEQQKLLQQQKGGKKISKRLKALQDELTKQSGRGVVALFYLNNTGDVDDEGTQSIDLSSKVQMFLHKNNLKKNVDNDVSTKYLKNKFADLMSDAEGSGDYAKLNLESECVFEVVYVGTEQEAFDLASRSLSEYSQKKAGPTVVLTDCSKPLATLCKKMSGINSFPVAPFQNLLENHALPAFQWEKKAADNALTSFLMNLVIDYPERVHYCRYANIPLGNLGSDSCCSIFDTFFARQLRKQRCLSWASNAGKPDLGYGVIDNSYMWADEEEMPKVVQPGVFRTVCVEMSISHLAIAALLTLDVDSGLFNTINKESGGAGDAEKDNKKRSLGDATAVYQAMLLLKAMVKTWYIEAQGMGNNRIIANDILGHCYRLVCAPESLLHDPALKRVLHSMMEKMFGMLISEFRRLGANVVYADFTKVIISTTKNDLKAAVEYGSFVLKTIKMREEFAKLMVDTSKFYSDLVFLDENNYGAMEFGVDGDVEAVKWTGEWNIAAYLAEDGDTSYNHFYTTMAKFSKVPFEKKQALLRSARKKIEKRNTAEATMTPQKCSTPVKESPESRLEPVRPVTPNTIDRYGVEDQEDDVEEGAGDEGPDEMGAVEVEFVEWLKKSFIAKSVAELLTRQVDEIDRLVDENGQRFKFPQLLGSYLYSVNPSLEFVKSVMKVMALDGLVASEVYVLRKSLLTQIGVQEYAEDTKWQQPCNSFVLNTNFCSNCYSSHDLNLCTANSHEVDGKLVWECPECASGYDMDTIEYVLVDNVLKRSAQYQVQDLRCSKRGGLITTSLKLQSDSSAPLVCDIDRGDFMDDLRTLKRVSSEFNLEWLGETVDSLTSVR